MPALPWSSTRRCRWCAAVPDAGDRFCTRCGSFLPPLKGKPWATIAAAGVLGLLVAVAVVAVIGSPVDPPAAVGPSGDPQSSGPPPTPPGDIGQAFGIANAFDESFCASARLECSTLTVPVDQLDPGPETMDVRFGVHRAKESLRIGTLVIATGGPGSSGIDLAAYYLDSLSVSIVERFDLVFMDQRGVGRSGVLACPEAGADEPPWADVATGTVEALHVEARLWVGECLEEAGLELNPGLDRYGTRHAAADLDAYLDAIGAGDVIVYGESYGTELAQVYAASRPERIAGLLLDGPLDPTIDPVSFAVEQSSSFSEVLDAVLADCRRDPSCAGDFGETDPEAVWDDLASRVADGPITVRTRVAGGGTREIRLGLGDLIAVAGGHLYTQVDRGQLLRVLAHAGRGDLLPLARTAELTAGRDPERGTLLATADGSRAAQLAILCQAHGPITGTTAISGLRGRVGEASGRLAGVAYSYVPCLSGFAGPAREEAPDWEALYRADFPTLLLTSTTDPATPRAWAEAVAHRMADAYVVVTTNGPHGTLGTTPCIDDVVKTFLVFGDVPEERQTTCHAGPISWYRPMPLASPRDYPDILDALVAIEEELWALPDFAYWDGVPHAVTCPHGGEVEMYWNGDDQLALDDCELIDGWRLTGQVTFAQDGVTTMSLQWGGGSVKYESTADWEVTVTGTVDGDPVELSRSVQ